jgi:hypothetical protein
MFLDMPVPFWLEKEASQAVEMCPALALSLATGGSRKSEPARAKTAIGGREQTSLLMSSAPANMKQLPRGR